LKTKLNKISIKKSIMIIALIALKLDFINKFKNM